MFCIRLALSFHASPVCKNYSRAKRDGGEVELDKETAQSTADFIADKLPKVVTIENVKGYKDSEALKIITDELTRQGYDWDMGVYNAAELVLTLRTQSVDTQGIAYSE